MTALTLADLCPVPSAEEAGRYLETYKAYEQKPADLLMEKLEQNFLSRVRLPPLSFCTPDLGWLVPLLASPFTLLPSFPVQPSLGIYRSGGSFKHKLDLVPLALIS